MTITQKPIFKALDEISDEIADEYNSTTESLYFAMILPYDTDELINVLTIARENLETAYNIVEELRQNRQVART